MAQINVTNLTFCYEGSFDYIFEDASFSIDTNWKLGFIGRNGKGKTTFFNLLLGKYEYEGSIMTSVAFDYFPYPISAEDSKKCGEELLEQLKPNCQLWKVVCELDKLKVDAEVLYRPFETLSFGERTKVMLAILFSEENEFLLIDEPTNHLDKASREIVKEYLLHKKGFILISHDRDLLDGCVDHVLVLNRQTIEVQKGNFSSWWENKTKKDAFSQMENEKHQKEIKKLKKAATRTKQWAEKSEKTKIGFDPVKEHDRCISTRAYIGAKTKKMQSRVTQMEHRINREIEEKAGLLKDIEEVEDLKLVSLKHHKQTLISLREYGLQYKDAQSKVLSDLTFEVKQGDRIVFSGKNGCGKSTLIKVILEKAGYETGQMSNLMEQGELSVASGLRISYINQDTSFLKGSIKDFCRNENLDESLFCALLRKLDMERVQFTKKLEAYSQGQKKKVLIAASLLTPAHLYIWDEPLNYIDVFSRMQIEKLLLSYQPTMILVEHDKTFAQKVRTKIVEF